MARRDPALLPLVLSSALSVSFVAMRSLLVGHTSYLFLLWNLLLAWIPYGLARLLAVGMRTPTNRALVFVLAVAFLGFLPNAPYLVTDLVHLKVAASAPYWFDALMFASFAWSGLVLGIAAVRVTAHVVHERLSKSASVAYVVVASALSAYGIYLGRFLRFNTWDAAFHPFSVARCSLAPLVNPREYSTAWLFTIMFSAFFLATYASLTTSSIACRARDS
ncbi:MAG: DUF1361 domain-containing protein [Polyangiaceae bacterium]